MHYITKLMSTETGHRLPRYQGKCAHLHGHTYRWEVTLSAPDVDSIGFVMDFADLKTIMKVHIGRFDHAFVLSATDPLVGYYDNRELEHFFQASNGEKGRLIILNKSPTVENLTRIVGEDIAKAINHVTGLMAKGVKLHKVKCWETPNSYADWKPS